MPVEPGLVTALVLNAALLIAVTHILALAISGRAKRSRRLWVPVVGGLLGLIGVGVMSFAFELQSGLRFDLRSVLLSIVGLFFGAVPTLVAMAVTGAFRIYQGGVGAFTGVAVILVSGCIGLAWRWRRRDSLATISWKELYVFGFVVNIAMLAAMPLTLPPELGRTILASIGLPVLLIYPLATVALGLVLAGRMQYQANVRALRDSELRYRSLFDRSQAIKLIADTSSGKIVDANPAAVKFYGYPRERLVGMPLAAISPGRSSPSGRAHRPEVALHQRADGSTREVEIFSTRISLDHRSHLHMIIHDISARKATERELAENQRQRAAEHAAAFEKQRRARLAALNMMEDAILARTRAETMLAELSRTKAKLEFTLRRSKTAGWELNIADGAVERSLDHDRIFGYRSLRDSWSFATFLDHVVPEDRAEVERLFKDVMQGGDEWDFQCRIRRTDGKVRWIWETGVVERDSDGKAQRLTGVMQDITSRKAEADLLRKLSLAVEQSAESIIITDLHGNIEYVNEAFVSSTGYSTSEVIGKNPRILKSGTTPPETYRDLWATISTGRSWSGEFYNRAKDGREYCESAVITPLRQPDGTITHFVAVKFDITENKQLIAKLQHYRDHLEDLVEQRTAELAEARRLAEAANSAKSIFLANMSHEIRTPMNAIIGMTYLIRKAGVAPEQSERLDKIDDAGRHLLTIINDVLDLTKIEAGRLELERENFELSSVLDNVASIVRESAHVKGLTVTTDHDHVPAWLYGDATRLRQCLLNFAGNAVKFTDAGSIAIRAGLVEDRGEELLVRFEVEDTGVGILPTDAERLFRAFEQGDVSTSRRYGGTGLGLAITQRLTQIMGGEIGVESTPGAGSRFWFTVPLGRSRGALPAADLRDREADAESLLRKRHAGARILLAEDNDVNRQIAVYLLQGAGLAVTSAIDGREAVEKALSEPFDLILMDMQMPNMDGLEATEIIRRSADWKDKPILALTANAFAEDRLACRKAGMSDVITKPVRPALLYATLLKWLGEPFEGSAGRDWTHVDEESPGFTGTTTTRLGIACTILDELGALLDKGDPAVVSLYARHAGLIREVLGLPSVELARQVLESDFVAARRTLEDLRRRH
jgi:PAS domain S-box-containing protein